MTTRQMDVYFHGLRTGRGWRGQVISMHGDIEARTETLFPTQQQAIDQARLLWLHPARQQSPADSGNAASNDDAARNSTANDPCSGWRAPDDLRALTVLIYILTIALIAGCVWAWHTPSGQLLLEVLRSHP